MKSLLRIFAAFSIFSLMSLAQAQSQRAIEIIGSGTAAFPIAVPVFENEGQLPGSISDIVRADLQRSGLFRLIDTGLVTLPESVAPNFADLKSREADYALTASVSALNDGRFEVRFRLFDTQSHTELGAMALRLAPSLIRATGHRIADFVYEKIIGQPGYFSTRIAYVIKTGSRYELQIADADGMNPQSALISNEPIISPAWAPDGQRLAYVSFEAKKPIIYVHNLPTGQRHVVANFKGSNSAPAWSPDGSQLAVVLTKDTGQSQIYLVNADGSNVRRFLSSRGIDTEPAWSADGKWIYFTSDRSGGAQIYRTPVNGGGQVERITVNSGVSYNVTPRPSPDGKTLIFITRHEGKYRVASLDLNGAKDQFTILTDSSKDESPSFAPNGQMVLYATENGGKGVLAAVSPDGKIKQRITAQAADIREPAWGPLPQ